ncbi:MAG: ACP S-malonyltransferase [Candidatus Omnitrophota bacterium]
MDYEKIAFIFPGQGAQYVGMGKDLYQKFESAKTIFEKSNECLGFDLKSICFEGPQEELTQSAICQPAILTLSIAVLEVLKDKEEFQALIPYACAGLSLGEYAALVACESLKFEDAVRLVHKRGQFMDTASKENPGTMSCILGLDITKTKEICQKTKAEIANLNCPGQIVLSGSVQAIAQANTLANEQGAKRVIPLDVSGPFHSSLMSSAAASLKKELDNVEISKPKVMFIPNVTAQETDGPEQIRQLLTQQVASTTYWEKSIGNLRNHNINTYLELGPGKVLKGLLQRIDRSLEVINLQKTADFDILLEKIMEIQGE